MKLLVNTKSKTSEYGNDENVPHLEITEVILVHCGIVYNDYQQNSKVSYTFVPNKLFGQLLDFSLKKAIFLKSYEFLSFAESMGKNIGKNISKNLSGKYSKKN